MKRKTTVYSKLIIAYIIFAILSFCVVSTLTSSMLREHMVKKQVYTLNREMSAMVNFYNSRYFRELNDDLVFGYISSVANYCYCEIWVMDSKGRIMVNTADSAPGQSSDMVVNDFDPTSIRGYMTGTLNGFFKQEMLTVYSAVYSGFNLRGYILMHIPLAKIASDINDLMNIYYYTAGIIFLLSLIILLVFTLFVYKPLKRITRATEEYAQGNYDYELKSYFSDEMGYLSDTLSFMASQIARGEENEKKFIANVSHDFRSPLTSIRGYVEAMMDGTIPREMMDKYLGIVLNETDRLTGLTNSLLQLNNLNVNGLTLDIEDFDINFMIKRTCESFEGRCLKRGISIELVLTDEVMVVTADESKIQQVMYNLLDNAIKFSPDASTIKIETTPKGDKLFVSVKDRGVGIPREAQSKIFDRFYKTDPSRGKDKKGTGLGLAIVKEIIKAHDETIDVISTEGVGTEFIFTVRMGQK